MDRWQDVATRWDWHVEEEARRAETFRRVHHLVRRGYQVDWTITDVDDALWLDHPAGGPALFVFADGTVVSRGYRGNGKVVINASAKEDQDRYYNETGEDAALFDRWLSTLPFPTAWQAGKPWRERKAYPLLILAFGWLIFLLVDWFISRWWQSS